MPVVLESRLSIHRLSSFCSEGSNDTVGTFRHGPLYLGLYLYHHDHVRRALMLEPRGHADMYGAVLTPPATDDGDVGVLFLHNEGYSTMCGHGIIGLVKVGLDCGLLDVPDGRSEVRIDSPAGRITARPTLEGERVGEVAFENVPSFVLAPEQQADVPGVGKVAYDLAYGGAFYAYASVVDNKTADPTFVAVR